MAHISAPYTTTPATPVFSGFGRWLLNTLVLIAEANPRMREVERLNAKSDKQLAQLGLKREDIARYVMRDILYL